MTSLANSLKFEQQQAAALAEPLPEPPQRLSDAALAFWPTIVSAKRRTAWTDSDLVIACGLCRDLALINECAAELARDGLTLVNAQSGRRYPHPATTILDATQRRVLATTRTLQIHAGATTGKTDHQGQKNEKARELARKLDNVHHLIRKPDDPR